MRRKYGILVMAALMAVTLSGCGNVHISIFPEGCGTKKTNAAAPQNTPTPTPEAQPTAVPAEITVTPLPTSTPAPRRIGTKTSTAKYIYLTNNLEKPIREIYLRPNGTEEWGKNLIPAESSVKSSETAQMFYSSTDGDIQYDMRVVDKSGNSYALYYVDLNDMDSAVLRLDDGAAYLHYMSKATGQESQNDYSEILAQHYDQWSDEDSNEMNQNQGDDWEVYYYGDDYSYDYDYNQDYSYDPYQDYSDYEGNPNYGYYDDYGSWISYY